MSGSAVNLASNNIQRSQIFTSSGNFTVPAGVTELTVLGVGGGAGGSTSSGGGAGVVPSYITTTVTPGAVIAVGIAGGGAGGGVGAAGGDSTFGSVATFRGAPNSTGKGTQFLTNWQNETSVDQKGFIYAGHSCTSGGRPGSTTVGIDGTDSVHAAGGAATPTLSGGGASWGAGGAGGGGNGGLGAGGGEGGGNGGNGLVIVYWSQIHD